MRSTKTLFAALAVAACLALSPAANAAVTVKAVLAGSSAMFTGTGVALFNAPTLGGGAGVAHKYTIGGSGCTGGINCAQLKDNRNASIPLQGGTLAVVWDGGGANANVWAYLTVDSVVGIKSFFANPKPILQISGDVLAAGKQQNLLAASLTGGQADDTTIPAAVYNALNGHVVTVGMTDIRPEDGLYATKRLLNKYTAANLNGLGYSATGKFKTSPIGDPIKSSINTANAVPVMFAIKGKDPFTLNAVTKTYTTRALGAAPIIFITNITDGTLAGLSNASRVQLLNVFDGDDCSTTGLGMSGARQAVNPALREGLSGTYNTTEFTMFRVYTSTAAPKTSQEKGVDPATQNPLGGTQGSVAGSCRGPAPQGFRQRGIGTGQVVNGAGGVGGVLNTPHSIGYTFFSFGNVANLLDTTKYAYIQVDGVDPLFHSYVGGDPGQPGAGGLPGCSIALNNSPGGCEADDIWTLSGGKIDSYPHVRDGSYRAWSVLRAVYESSDAAADAVFDALQGNINTTVPDLIPYDAVAATGTVPADDGLQVYRSHFKNQIAGKNTPEAGGDMGGCILSKPVTNTNLNLHQGNGGGPGTANCWDSGTKPLK